MSVCDNLARLMYQYQDSPLLRQMVLALSAEHCELSLEMDVLETRLDIALSVGVQLDLIGIIVGQARPISVQIDENDVFAFDLGTGKGWSGRTRADVGGRFIGINGLAVAAMFDDDYRTLLRARIFTNTAEGTVDDIGLFLAFVLGPGPHQVRTSLGVVDITVGRQISGDEEDIIRLLAPVAAGILLRDVLRPT